jgi:hypothetical protein
MVLPLLTPDSNGASFHTRSGITKETAFVLSFTFKELYEIS